MAVCYLRIITISHEPKINETLIQSLSSLPCIYNLHMEPIRPYWKHPEKEELACSFESCCSIEDLRSALADNWDADVADGRRGAIHLPGAAFLWLSD